MKQLIIRGSEKRISLTEREAAIVDLFDEQISSATYYTRKIEDRVTNLTCGMILLVAILFMGAYLCK